MIYCPILEAATAAADHFCQCLISNDSDAVSISALLLWSGLVSLLSAGQTWQGSYDSGGLMLLPFSVTRFDMSLSRHFGNICQMFLAIFEGLFSSWQKFEPTLAIWPICMAVIFQCWKNNLSHQVTLELLNFAPTRAWYCKTCLQ